MRFKIPVALLIIHALAVTFFVLVAISAGVEDALTWPASVATVLIFGIFGNVIGGIFCCFFHGAANGKILAIYEGILLIASLFILSLDLCAAQLAAFLCALWRIK